MSRAVRLGLLVIAVAVSLAWALAGATETRADVARITVAYTGYDSLDPQVAYSSTSWQVQYETCSTLLNYTDDPAPNGWALVPDAATALPTVSNGGLTYTFTIRPGLGFSDGSGDVAPDSFVRAFERLATGSKSVSFYFQDLIAGFSDYANGSATSISGLQVSGDQLQITLTQPDGSFPAKLAMPEICAVPASTPLAEADTTAFPSSGPYYVDPSSVTTDGGTNNGDVTGFHLLKNPYYGGSRPATLDEIDVTIDSDPHATYLAAQDPSPTIDYTAVTPSDQSAANTSFGPGSDAALHGHQQYFAMPDNGSREVWLNTSEPEVQNVDVREAVATVIDRNQLAADYGDAPSDNFVAASIPGYHEQDTYNLAGDVPAAQALMENAGYGPGNHLALTVATVTGNGPGSVADADLVSELQSIYIDVTTVPESNYYGFLFDPSSAWDVAIGGWIPDYGDMYAVLGPQFDGRLITGSSVGADISHWSDAGTDAALDYANGLAGTDARGTAFEQLAQSLATDSVPGAAFSDVTNHEFVGSRIGCVVYQPIYGLDLGRLCLANQVPANGTYTEPGTVSSDDPVLASVTTPTAGDVSVVAATSSSQETGYTVIGQQLLITAPAATAASPLSITLTVDATTLSGAGVTAATVAVLRNGVSVPACTANDGTATPDPCVSSRTTDGVGNALLTILTSEASTWSIAVPDTTPPTLNKVSLAPSEIAAGQTTTVSAAASSDAVAAEFYVDTDAGAGGNIPMSGGNGNFTTPPYGQLLAAGKYTIGVRVRDAAGNWSAVKTTTLHIRPAPPPHPPHPAPPPHK